MTIELLLSVVCLGAAAIMFLLNGLAERIRYVQMTSYR